MDPQIGDRSFPLMGEGPEMEIEEVIQWFEKRESVPGVDLLTLVLRANPARGQQCIDALRVLQGVLS